MRVKAAATVTAAVVGIALWTPATAAADDISWNPFLFVQFCSTCGPLTPLTLEQADARDLLPWEGLSVGPPVSDPVPFDNGVITVPVGPPSVGGSSNGGAPPVQLPSANGGGNGANGNGGTGNGGNGNGGNGNGGNNGTGDGGGLDYSITVRPPTGPDGPPGPNGTPGGGNPPTFEIGGGTGGGVNPITTTDTYDGGHEGETLIPEPATLLLLGSGLSAAVLRRRRGCRTA